MKCIPNITLSDDELDLLIEDNKFDYGGEAIVCRNNNPNTLYKIFVQPGTNIPDIMSDNKQKKVEWLYQNEIEDTVRPISTLSNRGYLIGYEISFDTDDVALINALLTQEEKIHFLHESARILQMFAKRDITYGDVKDDNVLINIKTGKAKFCDVDNIRIGNLPIDIMGHGLVEYFDANQTIDEKADAFMHNLLLLEQLKYHNLSHQAILNRLRTNPIMPEFPEEAERILTSLLPPEKFQGEYAISYIKRR
jgi:serine/threonine protein kinase